MLEEIYNSQKENIDEVIKKALNSVKENLINIEIDQLNKNKELVEAIEENCNIKLGIVAKNLYLKGLQDGINLILEAKTKKY